ncbi:MAG: hypothetical protein ABI572_10550 [Actinomycetota bacterium]
MGGPGIAVIVGSGALVLGAALARRRMRRLLADAVVALGGAGLGVGGLLVLEHPARSAWVIAPLSIAILAVLQVRVLTAPGGPMRT